MQILVINKVRVLGSGPHITTQLFWKYLPGVKLCHYKMGNFAKLPIAYCLANVK